MKTKNIFSFLLLFLLFILFSDMTVADTFTTTVRNQPWRFDPGAGPAGCYRVNASDTFIVINGTTGNPAPTINVFFRDDDASPMSPTYVIAPGARDSLPLGGVHEEEYLCATQAGKPIPDSCFVDICYKEGPTLTQWGIIGLVGLLLASTVFIMLRRRRATVPA